VISIAIVKRRQIRTSTIQKKTPSRIGAPTKLFLLVKNGSVHRFVAFMSGLGFSLTFSYFLYRNRRNSLLCDLAMMTKFGFIVPTAFRRQQGHTDDVDYTLQHLTSKECQTHFAGDAYNFKLGGNH
jgi:hypothetical protein